ncbi:hypothetical protein DAPPUDRAFT_274825 [Daphnia pulex]|uniref:Uncharacterized protein n=1 Tax=Daphnia pulex TaxID=6669 RepID=E9I4S6_DAPPU|nr:hypothetical protein DAPPUDRAFT_274825 [Daphnia pulex]|eukprot:EFX61004.1 hypothetical protein DAPPUDRAFT_274825 [Daphnia pulex]
MATKSQRQLAAERVVRLCEKLMTTDPVFNVKTNPSAGVEYVYEPAADQKVKDGIVTKRRSATAEDAAT